MTDIEITESEHVALIKAAVNGKYLSCSFGNGVYLRKVEGNEWAFGLLSHIRADQSAAELGKMKGEK